MVEAVVSGASWDYCRISRSHHRPIGADSRHHPAGNREDPHGMRLPKWFPWRERPATTSHTVNRSWPPAKKRGAVPLVTSSVLEHRPHGIVGLITPWNYPFLLSMADALPALLAGNAVVLKPSELTPLSAILGRELLVDSGLDPDLLGIVHGAGDVGGELIRHVDYIGFTGGSATGRKGGRRGRGAIDSVFSRTWRKEPHDRPQRRSIEGMRRRDCCRALFPMPVRRAFRSSASTSRRPSSRSFPRSLRPRQNNLKLGWSPSWDLDVGSLIHAAHAEKVMGHIEEAVQGGARVLAGASPASGSGTGVCRTHGSHSRESSRLNFDTGDIRSRRVAVSGRECQ